MRFEPRLGRAEQQRSAFVCQPLTGDVCPSSFVRLRPWRPPIVGVTFSGCSGSGSGGGDIATVNDQHITKADFDHRLESSPAAKQILSQIVQQALIDQYGKDNKIDVTQADIDKKEADIKSKYPPGQFEQILKQQGLTEADVQNILRDQLIIEKAVDPSVHVTDADDRGLLRQEPRHARQTGADPCPPHPRRR